MTKKEDNITVSQIEILDDCTVKYRGVAIGKIWNKYPSGSPNHMAGGQGIWQHDLSGFHVFYSPLGAACNLVEVSMKINGTHN